jgi:hypothetical protein
VALQSKESYIRKHRYDDDQTFVVQRQGSVRAQIRRAVLLVKALARVGALDPEDYPRVLVVGGGVTGAAVACAVADNGGEAVLIEAQKNLFPVQYNCSTRWLHPHENDWPLPHHDIDGYPFTSKDCLLSPPPRAWRAGTAEKIAKSWEANMFRRERDSKAQLRILTDSPVSIEATAEQRSPRFISMDSTEDEDSEPFSLIIFCVGGEEPALRDCAYGGFKYWQNDPFTSDRMGKPQSEGALKVLIAGGGDGGLQDLFRVTLLATNTAKLHSALSVYQHIQPALDQSDSFERHIKKWMKQSKPNRPKPELMSKDHKECVDAMRREDCWQALKDRFVELLHPEFSNGTRVVTLVAGQRGFPDAFAINSFLFHILEALIEESSAPLRDSLQVVRRVRIDSIISRSSDHSCAGDPWTCHQYSHDVALRPPIDTTETAFDVVILRMGLDHLLDCNDAHGKNE